MVRVILRQNRFQFVVDPRLLFAEVVKRSHRIGFGGYFFIPYEPVKTGFDQHSLLVCAKFNGLALGQELADFRNGTDCRIVFVLRDHIAEGVKIRHNEREILLQYEFKGPAGLEMVYVVQVKADGEQFGQALAILQRRRGIEVALVAVRIAVGELCVKFRLHFVNISNRRKKSKYLARNSY